MHHRSGEETNRRKGGRPSRMSAVEIQWESADGSQDNIRLRHPRRIQPLFGYTSTGKRTTFVLDYFIQSWRKGLNCKRSAVVVVVVVV